MKFTFIAMTTIQMIFYIEEFIKGSDSSQVLHTMQYNPETLAMTVKKSLDSAVKSNLISPREAVKLTDFYEDCLDDYTYLK